MAHRHQHGAVRGSRPGARLRVGALSSATLVAFALIASAACAQEWVPRSELISTSLPDVAAWWSEYGRPGWIADRWLDGEAPWVLAGHVRGTFRIEEPGRAPRRLIDPEGAGSFTPVTWYDSVRIVPGAGAAWQGYSGAMMTVEGRTGGAGPKTAEGIVDLRSGDGAWDENSLMVSRRDSLSWLRIESHGLKRGPAGSMELSGRHLWGVGVGVERGHHTVEANFAQQGLAATLLGTEQEDLTGQVGSGTYRYDRSDAGGEVTFARGLSRAVSFSDYFALSRRATAASEVSARAWHRSGLNAGGHWQRERAARDGSDEFNVRAASFWGVVGWAGDAGAGRLTLDVGAGKHDQFSGTNVAPAVRYEVHGRGIVARVGGERVLNAVWNELALGQAPFMQRSLVGVADVTLGLTRARQLRTVVLVGRTTSRAVASRVPLSEVVLRTGYLEDTKPFTFALASIEARADGRRFFGEALAFGLSRPSRAIQPDVDPAVGARGVVGTRWRMFAGDLGVEVWAGLNYVGTRESEFSASRVLPDYGVSDAGLRFMIKAAEITIRGRNFEDRFHTEPWTDSSGGAGFDALGPGREIRFALTMQLSN